MAVRRFSSLFNLLLSARGMGILPMVATTGGTPVQRAPRGTGILPMVATTGDANSPTSPQSPLIWSMEQSLCHNSRIPVMHFKYRVYAAKPCLGRFDSFRYA